jgi:hypothetical protein
MEKTGCSGNLLQGGVVCEIVDAKMVPPFHFPRCPNIFRLVIAKTAFAGERLG